MHQSCQHTDTCQSTARVRVRVWPYDLSQCMPRSCHGLYVYQLWYW